MNNDKRPEPLLNTAREACRRLYQTDRILLHYVLDGK